MKKLFFTVAIFATGNAFAQLYIGNGTSLVINGNPTITLHDMSVVNDGTVLPGSSTFRFSGMSNASIGGSSPLHLFNMRLVKSLAGATVSLLQDIEVSNTVEFGPGFLNLNDKILDLGTTGMLVNESENSRISTQSTGKVVVRSFLAAPAAQNPGNLGAILTSTQNMGEVTVRRGHLSQTNGSGQGNSIHRYFDIIPQNNSALNATLRFQYFNAELNALDESGLMLWSSPDNSTWTNLGYTLKDGAANFVELSGIPSMMRFTLSSPANPLPVTGLLLSGRWENDRAELKWSTESEFNNSHFDVQRRYQDQQGFYVTGRKYSNNPGGTSQTISTYYYTDPASSSRGTIFYRLEQSDLDGRISFSNTIALNPGGSSQFINYISNSGIENNWIFIQTGSMPLQRMEIMIMDAAGKIYMRKQASYTSQDIVLPVMAPGVYYIRIISGPHQFISSLIK